MSDEKLQNVASFLHSVFCSRFHVMTMEQMFDAEIVGCRWYLEEQLAETWEQEGHTQWLEQAAAFHVMSNGEADEAIKALMEIAVGIEELVTVHPGLIRYVELLTERHKEVHCAVKGDPQRFRGTMDVDNARHKEACDGKED